MSKKEGGETTRSIPFHLATPTFTPRVLTVALLAHVNLVLQSTLIPQPAEPLQCLLERNQFAHLLGCRIVAVADVHGAGFLFFRADDYTSTSAVIRSQGGCYVL